MHVLSRIEIVLSLASENGLNPNNQPRSPPRSARWIGVVYARFLTTIGGFLMIPIIAGFSFSQRKIRRKEFRKALFEALETRQLFASLPTLQPPSTPPDTQPPIAELPSLQPPRLLPPILQPPLESRGSPPTSDIFGPKEQVWISQFDPCIEGGSSPARIRIERTNTRPPLEVQWLALSNSTAQPDLDYISPKPIAKFAPGQTFVDLFFNPIDDPIPEATETIKIILTDSSRLGTMLPHEPTILQITDNDASNSDTFVEWIDCVDGQEGGQPATLRARRTGSLNDELLVPFSISPQAGLSLETDFQFTRNDIYLKNQTGTLRFPKGSAIATQRWNLVDDTTAEGTEWCDLHLLTTDERTYQLAGNKKQTLRILDNDLPPADNSPKNGDGTLLTGPYIARIELVVDSGSSSSDKISTCDTLKVTYQGDWIGGTLISEFDWNSDGIPELVRTDTSPLSSFEFSPNELDTAGRNPLGPHTVSYRTKLLSDTGSEITCTPWKVFSYFIVEDPQAGPFRLRNLRLKSDTGILNDSVTTDPTVLVDLYGQRSEDDPILSHLNIEWDHSGDGIPDALLPVPTPTPNSLTYDPRSTDQTDSPTTGQRSISPGPRTIRARLFDDRSGEPLSAWLSIDFTLEEPPSSTLTVDSIQHFSHSDSTLTTQPSGIIQGNVRDTNTITESSGSAQSNDFTVELDSNLDRIPDACIEVAEDLTFEHSLEHLAPGRYTFAYRAREWNQSLQCFLYGKWTPYTFDWNPIGTPEIRSIQLRSDTGEFPSDLRTSDPAIRIEIAPSESLAFERFLDIDTTGDEARTGNLDEENPRFHTIRISDQNLVLFTNPNLQPGLQRYWFRTRIRHAQSDPATDENNTDSSNTYWESCGDWQVFEWYYQPPAPADIQLRLLLDDGLSSGDRVTSLPTILGNLSGEFDEFTTIQVDLGEEENRPTKIQPKPDGSFTIRLPAKPFGHRTLWVRSERTDPFLATPVLSDWKAFDFQLVPPVTNSDDHKIEPDISVRLLVDSGTSDKDRTSNTITLVGNLTKPSPIGWIEIDRNGDGNPDDCITTNPEGSFVYTPLKLPFGDHIFSLRSKRLADNLESIEFGTWQSFDFTYVANTDSPLRIETIQLLDDTGEDADRRTVNPSITGIVSSQTGYSHAIVLVDHNADGIADESVSVDSQGRFIYTPSSIREGQWNYAFRPLRIEVSTLNSGGNNSTLGTEPWVDFTFQLEGQSNEMPIFREVLFFPPSSGQLPSIRGKVSSQCDYQALNVDLDLNNDGNTDRILSVDPFGMFNYPLDALPEGDSQVQIRTRTTATTGAPAIIGSWQSVAVRGEPTPTIAPRIISMTLLDDGQPIDEFQSTTPIVRSPQIRGLVDRLSRNYPLSIEFDSNLDDFIDGQATVSDDRSFHFIPSELAIGPFTLRARSKEVLPDGTVLRSPWTSVSGRLESNPTGLLTLSPLGLENNQGASDDDQRSDNPVLVGQILGPISRTSSWILELESENGTSPRRSFEFQGPNFSIAIPFSQPGIQSLQIRIRNPENNKQSDWIPFRFLAHPSPKSPQADAWVNAYRSIATQIASAQGLHVQGLASTLTQLAHDRASLLSDRELRNEYSFSSRLDSIDDLHENSWKKLVHLEEDFQNKIERALITLSESLTFDSLDLTNYPLEQDLPLTWPTTPLPEVPSFEELVAHQQTITTTPNGSPPNLSSLSDPERQIDLENHEPYQRELQQLNSAYLYEIATLSSVKESQLQEAQTRRIHSQQIALLEYQETLKRIAEQFSRATKDLLPNGFVEPDSSFVDRCKEVEISYRQELQDIQSQFQRIAQAIEAQAVVSRQIAVRKRDQAKREATQELQSTLGMIPPPSSTALESAIKTYARKFYDADYAFDQDILGIDTEIASASDPLQIQRYQAMFTAKSRYLETLSNIEVEQRTKAIEKNHRNSTQRNLADSTRRLAQIAAKLKLQIAENQTNKEYERYQFALERDYQINLAREARQLQLQQAQATLSTREQLHSLIASSWSSYQLAIARQQVEQLRELEPIEELRSSEKAQLQFTRQVDQILARESQIKDELNVEAEQATARVKAIALYRSEHANLVRSYQIQQTKAQLDSRTSLNLAQEKLDLDRSVLQIEIFQLQGKIGRAERGSRLSAQVYTPPDVDSATLALGWLGSNPFMWFHGTVKIPWSVALSLTLSFDNQMKNLNFSFQKTWINIDETFLNQRDQIVENFAIETNRNRQSAQNEEQKILQNYHMSAAFIDREYSLSMADSHANYSSSNTESELEEILGIMELMLRTESEKSRVLSNYKEQERLSRYDWLEQNWNAYINRVQEWYASDPTTWSEYTLVQNELERAIALAHAHETYRDEVRKSSSESIKELALHEQSLRKQFLEAQALQALRHQDIESQYTLTKERVEATFLFSTQIAGITAQASSNRSSPPPTLINHPWEGPTFSVADSTLEIKKKIVAETAEANRANASAEVTKHIATADARFQRDTAIEIANDSLNLNLISWERYLQLLQFANSQFQYAQEAIETEYTRQLDEINESLRQARAQSVYDLNRLIAMRQMPTAEWSYQSSIPNLLIFENAQRQHDNAIHDAELKATRTNENAQATYRTTLQEIDRQDRQQVEQILSRFEAQCESSTLQYDVETLRSQYSIKAANASRIETADASRLNTLVQALNANWQSADTNTKQWLSGQAQFLKQRQLLLSDSNRKFDLENVLLSLQKAEAIQPSILAHQERIRNAADSLRSQVDELTHQSQTDGQIAQLQKRSDEDNEQRDWIAARTAIERQYDLKSKQNLDSLNQKLIASRQQAAEQIAQTWKDYYLAVHPTNLLIATQRRNLLDNWIGASTQNTPTSHFAWIQKPILPSNNPLDISPVLSQNRELENHLLEIQSTQTAFQTEFQIDYLLDLGTLKTQRLSAIFDTQASFSADRYLAENEYANAQIARSLTLANALFDIQNAYQQQNYEFMSQHDVAQSLITKNFDNLLQAKTLEKLQRNNRATIQLDVDRASAQAEYWTNHFRRLSEGWEKLGELSPRDAILQEHTIAKTNWLDTVSQEWIATSKALSQAKATEAESVLKMKQEGSQQSSDATFNHQIQNSTISFQGDKDLREIAYQNQRLTQLQEAERNTDYREQQYAWEKENLETLEAFHIAYERAKILDLIMEIRGVPDAARIQETELLIAKAKRDRDGKQAEANKRLRQASTGYQLQEWLDEQNAIESFAKAKRNAEAQTNRQLILSSRDFAIENARIDASTQSQLVLISQVRSVEEQHATNAWSVATASATIAARESLADLLPSDWSTLLVLRAITQHDDAFAIAEVDLQAILKRNDSEWSYSQTKSQSQQDQFERNLIKQTQWKLNQIEFDSSIEEARAEAIEDYMNSIEESLTQTIEKVASAERDYEVGTAEAAWIFAQDHDLKKFQEENYRLRERLNVANDQVATQWGSSKAFAIAARKSKEANLDKQALDWILERDQAIATELRENRYQAQVIETHAYEQAIENWGEIDLLRADEIAKRFSQSASSLNDQLQNTWSRFYEDYSIAQAELQRQNSLLKSTNNSTTAKIQAEHEMQQAETERLWDAGQWLVSSAARNATATLDQTLEGTKIASLRTLASSGWIREIPLNLKSIPEFTISTDTRFAPRIAPDSFREDHRGELTIFVDQRIRDDLIVGMTLPWEKPQSDVFRWKDTGFLRWLQDPLEQWPKNYWNNLSHWNSSLVDEYGEIRNDTSSNITGDIQLNTFALLPVYSWTSPTVSSTQVALMPLPSVDDNVSLQDTDFDATATNAITWLKNHVKTFDAATRPELEPRPNYSDLLEKRYIVWPTSPIALQQPPEQPIATQRFYISNASQWSTLIGVCTDPSAGSSSIQHAQSAYDDKPSPLEIITGKLREHIREQSLNLDTQRDKLTIRKAPLNDEVTRRNNDVYWRWVFPVSSPLELGQYQHVETKIGTVDQHGWVYLQNGKRVLYSALRKWAGELRMANAIQINRLIDGLISPYVFDPTSKQYGIFIGGTGMHFYGLGNVEKLYNAYQGSKFYYGGIGNPIEYENYRSLWADQAAGFGWSSILRRIEADFITFYRPKQKIHVFGWSRGAALAHEFSKLLAIYNVEVDFLGLFDPVYSYVFPGQSSKLVAWSESGRDGNYISVEQTKNAKAITALYAANEDRSFFPASRFFEDGVTKMRLMMSPGGHGEVGGHYESNLIVQRLNMKAMMEFADTDGNAVFMFHGIDEDIAHIFNSPITEKVALKNKPLEFLESYRSVYRVANSYDAWNPLTEQQYHCLIAAANTHDWAPGKFGSQQGNWSGFLASYVDFGISLLPPWCDTEHRQSIISHYPRYLHWCPLHLWSVPFMTEEDKLPKLTPQQLRILHHMYSLRIDPENGYWAANQW